MLQVPNHTNSPIATNSPITTDMPIILRLCSTQRTSLYLLPQRRNKTSRTLNLG